MADQSLPQPNVPEAVAPDVLSEEEWPDNDVDRSTAEGAEIARKSEAALMKSIECQVEARCQQFRGPAIAYEIPKALYEKAQNQQDKLTGDERALLLSRGDLAGKALAQPASLTLEERYEVMRWPPPGVVRANIQRATGGALSDPTELFAKAREAIERGQLASLSDEEITLIALSFRKESDLRAISSQWISWRDIPGNIEATNLLLAESGFDKDTYRAVSLHRLTDPDSQARMAARMMAGEANDKGPGLGPGATGIPTTQQSLQNEEGSFAAGGSQVRDGEQALDAIVDRMWEVQQKRDRGDLDENEFRTQNRSYITALRTYTQNRRHRAHPYSGPASRVSEASGPNPGPNTHITLPPPPGLPPALAAAFTLRIPRAPVPTHPSPTNLSGPRAVPGAPPSAPDNEIMGGQATWPPQAVPVRPLNVLGEDLRVQMGIDNLLDVGFDGRKVAACWNILTEEQRAAYKAKSEALRLEAWAKFANSPPPVVPPEVPPVTQSVANPANQNTNWPAGWPPMIHPGMQPVGPLKFLTDDLKVQLGVEKLTEVWDDYGRELSAHWKALTDEQRAAYEAKSEAARLEAWANLETERKKTWQEQGTWGDVSEHRRRFRSSRN